MAEVCTNPEHTGHKVYVGGIMDGQVDHLVGTIGPSRFGMSLGTLKRGGQRTWYLRDADLLHGGTTAVYRAVAVSAEAPPEVVATYPTPAPVAEGSAAAIAREADEDEVGA